MSIPRRFLPLVVIAFALLSGGGATAVFALRGPPTLCFPFEIGDAKTLPDAGERDKLGDTPLQKAAIEVLDANRDAVVHMDTLRRAFFIAKDPAERLSLLSALERRVLEHETTEPAHSAHDLALSWFDLGYWRRAIDQGMNYERGSAFRYVDKALRIDPDDAGLRLGAMNCDFDDSARRELFYADIVAAHRLLSDETTLTARNFKAIVERFAPELMKDGYAHLGERAAVHVSKRE